MTNDNAFQALCAEAAKCQALLNDTLVICEENNRILDNIIDAMDDEFINTVY